jgi:hypothetical protein
MSKRYLCDMSKGSRGDFGDMPLGVFNCTTCDTVKPITQFSPSAVSGKHHTCRHCSTLKGRAAKKLWRDSLSRRLLSKLRQLMHKSGKSRSETRRLNLSDMVQVMHRFGSRSVFSGVGCIDRLTVVVWDRNAAVTFGNVVICTHAEASRHNSRTLCEYHNRFVEHVQTRLLIADARKGSMPRALGEDGLNGCHGDGKSARGAEAHTDPSLAFSPFPPMSKFARGITSDVMTWYLSNFGIPYPTISSPSRNARYARLDHMPESNSSNIPIVCCN